MIGQPWPRVREWGLVSSKRGPRTPSRAPVTSRPGKLLSPSTTRPADRVHGVDFTYAVRIGFHDFERHIKQRVRIEFEAETDWRRAAQDDDEAMGLVDYFEVNQSIQELLDSRPWRLVEAVAEAVAELICRRFNVSGVRVKVTKAPMDMPNVGAVAVECWRVPADYAESPPEAGVDGA